MRHWFRVDMGLSDLGACPHWLTARHPSLILDRFKEWWCPLGSLCRLHAGAGAKPHLQQLWDPHSPALVTPAVGRSNWQPSGNRSVPTSEVTAFEG